MSNDLERQLILAILDRTAPDAAREVMGIIRHETARLREAGDRLVPFVRHYPRCAFIRGRDECNCHHGEVVKAWKEARAKP